MNIRLIPNPTDAPSKELLKVADLDKLTLAEELSGLALKKAGIHHAPGC